MQLNITRSLQVLQAKHAFLTIWRKMLNLGIDSRKIVFYNFGERKSFLEMER